jgi:hypothetical protein
MLLILSSPPARDTNTGNTKITQTLKIKCHVPDLKNSKKDQIIAGINPINKMNIEVTL